MEHDTGSEGRSSPKKGLAARLQSAAAADQEAVESYRKEIEAVTQQQLSELAQSTRKLWQRELNVIESAIRAEAGGVARLTSKLWKHLLLYALIASGALYLGLWGPMQWHLRQLSALEAQREELAAEINGYNAALNALKSRTAGLQVRMNEGKAWVVLPTNCRKSQPCLQLPDDWHSN